MNIRMTLGTILLVAVTGAEAATLPVPSELYPTIQAAVDSAAAGDSVLVAPGIYTGEGNRDIDFGGKDLVVTSEAGPEFTEIDVAGSASAPHRGFIFTTLETSDAVVDGFTIRNGFVSDEESLLPHVLSGGGFYCLAGASPTIRNCIIVDCHSQYSGGAIGCEGLLVTPTIINCVMKGNSCTEIGGGAISAEVSASPTLIDCVITGNRANLGGGVFLATGGTAQLLGCTIAGNHAFLGTAVDERGGGIFCEGGCTASIERTIVWNNCADEEGDDVFVETGGMITFTCSTWNPAGKAGDGQVIDVADNLEQDPLFCNPQPCEDAPTTDGDYSLDTISPCLPDESPCGSLIGALDQGCSTPIRETTWGLIKGRYRR